MAINGKEQLALTAAPTERPRHERNPWSSLDRGDELRNIPLDVAFERIFRRR